MGKSAFAVWTIVKLIHSTLPWTPDLLQDWGAASNWLQPMPTAGLNVDRNCYTVAEGW